MVNVVLPFPDTPLLTTRSTLFYRYMILHVIYGKCSFTITRYSMKYTVNIVLTILDTPCKYKVNVVLPLHDTPCKYTVNVVLPLPDGDTPYKYTVNVFFTLTRYSLQIYGQRCFTLTRYSLQIHVKVFLCLLYY